MGDFLRYAALAVGLAVTALTLRHMDRPYGLAFSLLAGAALLIVLADPLREALAVLRGIAEAAGKQGEYALLAVKLLGVAYAAEFAAQACRDAGEEGIALRVELSARILLVTLSAPLLRQMAAVVLELTA